MSEISSPRKSRVSLISCVGLIFLACALLFLWRQWKAMTPYQFHGTSYTEDKSLSDFFLTGQTGRPVKLSDFRGKVVLLEFGFTTCPNICPTSLADLAMINRNLRPEEREKVQVLFVTVDPQRDTPAKLAEYMPFFDERFLGLTGTPEEIETAAKDYGAYYRRLPLPGRPDDYTMDHSTYTYLIDREGRLRVMYDLRKLRDTNDIVRDIRHLLPSS